MTSDRHQGLLGLVFVSEIKHRIGERQLEGAMGSAVIAIGNRPGQLKSVGESVWLAASVQPSHVPFRHRCLLLVVRQHCKPSRVAASDSRGSELLTYSITYSHGLQIYK